MVMHSCAYFSVYILSLSLFWQLLRQGMIRRTASAGARRELVPLQPVSWKTIVVGVSPNPLLWSWVGWLVLFCFSKFVYVPMEPTYNLHFHSKPVTLEACRKHGWELPMKSLKQGYKTTHNELLPCQKVMHTFPGTQQCHPRKGRRK